MYTNALQIMLSFGRSTELVEAMEMMMPNVEHAQTKHKKEKIESPHSMVCDTTNPNNSSK